MKIIIELSDETYKDIKEEHGIYGINNGLSARITGKVVGAIQSGTSLPKGHGRIGDLSKIYVELNEAQIEGTEEYKGLGKAKQIICNAKSIIEADKESEGEE